MQRTIYMISTMFLPSIGGVENHIYFLSKYIVKMGLKVKVIKPTLAIEKTNVYNMDGIEIHEIKCGDNLDVNKYEKYKRFSNGLRGFFYGYKRKCFYNKFSNEIFNYIESDIKINNVDTPIIHQHDFISSIKLSKRLSKKYNVVFTNHTGEFLFLKKLPFSNFIIKLLTNHFKFIIAPSEELAEFKSIRLKETYRYIPNGVDLDIFKKYEKNKVYELKSKYKLGNDKIIILCPRRWAPTKGIIYLIEAINDLKDRGLNNKVVFVFVGNEYMDYSEYRKEIIDYIDNNSLNNMIKLLGNVKSSVMSELINCSEVVAIPSLMEAVSLSALEAMACGKIILSTNVGGFPQIIEDGVTGYMVAPKDSKALADKLYKLINNINNESKIGDSARKFVINNYSWEKVAIETIRIYDSII